MIIIISPTKKMKIDEDSYCPVTTAEFTKEAAQIVKKLKTYSLAELQKLYGSSLAIAKENYSRLQSMDPSKGISPAIYSYEGIQFQYMAPQVFDKEELEYIQKHLRILSGLYGILKPFDQVMPYRLEMQTKLAVGKKETLYEFWGSKPAKSIAKEGNVVINLASKEYSQVVIPHLPKRVRVVHCTFGELKDNKVIEKGTLCKMARGEMVRFMAENKVISLETLKKFNGLGYQFCQERSSKEHYVFIKV